MNILSLTQAADQNLMLRVGLSAIMPASQLDCAADEYIDVLQPATPKIDTKKLLREYIFTGNLANNADFIAAIATLETVMQQNATFYERMKDTIIEREQPLPITPRQLRKQSIRLLAKIIHLHHETEHTINCTIANDVYLTWTNLKLQADYSYTSSKAYNTYKYMQSTYTLLPECTLQLSDYRNATRIFDLAQQLPNGFKLSISHKDFEIEGKIDTEYEHDKDFTFEYSVKKETEKLITDLQLFVDGDTPDYEVEYEGEAVISRA